jgi:hypothetical protein
MKKSITVVSNKITALCQRVSAAFVAPTEKQARAVLFVAGLGLIALSFSFDAIAQNSMTQTKYNDSKVANAVNAVLTYLEGSFGALVMAAAGIGSIMSAAFGQYKAALSLMIVAVGAFILRSFMSTFFNDLNIQD